MKALAVSACVLFIAWLYYREGKLRPMTSPALWIPLLWVIIIGSRTGSLWLNMNVDPQMLAVDALEGNPFDRNVFLLLIALGVMVIFRRRLNWGRILSGNPWLFAFLLYCGLSAVWSDYPFPSLKKWTKDLGNVVMILVILTEVNPMLAIRAVFSRYLCFVIPFSALLMRYIPELGTYIAPQLDAPQIYNPMTGAHRTPLPEVISYCGVTTNKNELGTILAITGIFLVWTLVSKKLPARGKWDRLVNSLLLVMAIALIIVADSMTALVCLAIGSLVILGLRIPLVRRQTRYLGIYTLAIAILVFLFLYIPDLRSMLFGLLGRDLTFTGRTEIWQGLLQEHVNPLLGTGFGSFWLQPGVPERYDYINEAHNGYLETYLNEGLIGLTLLGGMIVSVWAKLKKELLLGNSFATLLFAFLVVTIFYNLTEAVFMRLNLTWFVFLMAGLGHPWTVAAPHQRAAAPEGRAQGTVSRRPPGRDAPREPVFP